MAKTVGAFKYEDGAVFGPADYMREQGNDYLDKIEAGNCAVFNYGAMTGKGDTVTLVLVALQTNYAGWKGMQQFQKGAKR